MKIRYELWITDDNNNLSKFDFDSLAEAYIYYVDNFATPEDDNYYFGCCGMHLKDIDINSRLVDCMFRNVFNQKHHLYEVIV